MDPFSIFGLMFGLVGFSLAIAASQKVSKLEEELKRRRVIDEDFGDTPEEGPTSDPSTWSAEKKARVEVARKKMVAEQWKLVLKLVLFFAVPIGAALALLFFKR